MKWFYKLERKLGKYAIKNLMVYIIILYGLGVLVNIYDPLIYTDYLSLDVYKILHGEVWRLLTFIITPPLANNVFFMIFSLYIYWMLGTIMEKYWGAFRFNVFLFGGILCTVLAAFITYFVEIAYYGAAGNAQYEAGVSYLIGAMITTEYINFSIFIGYAFTFPEAEMLLFFVIPIKAKILGWLEIIVYIVIFATSGLVMKMLIGTSLLNVLVFLLITKKIPVFRPAEFARKADFKAKVNENRRVNRHKCAICGKTSDTAPDETFRYCSKCDGNFEYCSEHLYTHTHVNKSEVEILNLPK